MGEPSPAPSKEIDLAAIWSLFVVNRREVLEAREKVVKVRESVKRLGRS